MEDHPRPATEPTPTTDPEATAPLFLLAYASAATHEFSEPELIRLLLRARARNQSVGITGMLLYDEGSFLQVLEGPEQAVVETYERIARDRRHDALVLLSRTQVDRRTFGEWAMGFKRVRELRNSEVPGLSRFMDSGRRLTDVSRDLPRAKQLLEAFRAGRWRQSTL